MSIPPKTQVALPWINAYAVMGIINATDDSFSGDGVGDHFEKGVQQGLQMISDGAIILDIGGESTRRYALYYEQDTEIPSMDEELKRVIPIFEMLRKKTTCMLSIDTNKTIIAEKAIEAGATCINYAWGGMWDDTMLSLAKEAKVPICLMHNSSSASYANVVDDVLEFLLAKARTAEQLGIQPDHILIDPGIGFQKSVQDSLVLLHSLGRFTQYPYPVLLGASRKSVIWKTLETTPIDSLPGSLATTLYGLLQGVKVFRTHDVKETVQSLKMTNAIITSLPVS